jgi:alkylation response protein AidB-like acyl-CoA dehydrogenase
VDFDFSAEQYALRDLARDLFEKESPPSRLRELYEGAAREPGAWRAMASVGLLGLTVPEAHGGMGGNEVDLALVLEEAGRAALPDPLLETVAVAAPSLVDSGDPRAATWLPRIASGDAIATVRIGGSPFALDADLADVLLEERDGSLHLLERGSFRTRPVESEDRARRLFAVESQTSDDTRLPGGLAAAARAFDRAAVAAAGMLNGISIRLLLMTMTHVKERQQFGRPVGSFQALKHRLADAHIAVESARAATWYAAYALAHGLSDAPLAASVAKAEAADAEALANRAALQFHAGIGFTWEHDLHLWLKRGKALEQAFGSAADHRARIARHVFEESDARA